MGGHRFQQREESHRHGRVSVRVAHAPAPLSVIPRRDLLRHLAQHGCGLLRERSKHSVWINPRAGARPAVPRHREFPLGTARAVCDQLGTSRL